MRGEWPHRGSGRDYSGRNIGFGREVSVLDVE